MKSFAEFKRRLKKGVKLQTVRHIAHVGRDENDNIIFGDQDLGVREVSIAQTNAFALKTKRTDGKVVDSWCYHPKAKDAKIDGNSITIYDEDYRVREGEKPMIPVLTYTFVE